MLTRQNIDYKRNRIVRVICNWNSSRIGFGTGFFISENQVLTCGHVVLGEDFKSLRQNPEFINFQGVDNNEKAKNYHLAKINNVEIRLDSGESHHVLLEKIDPNFDIALLRVNEDHFSHSYFDVEKLIEPYLGEEISFYGYPEVLGHTYQNSPFVVNTSIISTFPVTEIGGGVYRHMQINATNIGGISGAPIFLRDQNTVVGIINGNFNSYFNNIVYRDQNGDHVFSTKVPIGIGYSTSMRIINDNTDIF